ncbi:MAG TPA: 30S ribosomal protein S7 [Patescibacteria group bacterium]|nr:30S ribosomal protein S7 [Patescibacteria group bacterium]
MARGVSKKIKRHEIKGDPVYGNILVSMFTNRLMVDGKKTIAQKVMMDAFEILKKEGNPVEIFEGALEAVGPKVEVKARRIGGAAYQVPTEVRGARKTALAIRWILEAAKKRPTAEFKTFSEKLAAELIAATKNEGEAIKKRDVAHRMAEANKAFSHFRW